MTLFGLGHVNCPETKRAGLLYLDHRIDLTV